MATTLTTSFDMALEWVYKSDLDAGSSGRKAVDSNTINYRDSLANGTGANAAEHVYSVRATLTDAANTDYDLSGSLTDAFGNTLSFTVVRGIFLRNRNTASGENLVLGGGTNAFDTFFSATGDSIILGPNAMFCLWNPSDTSYAVTAGTGDILRVTASGGNITYDLVIVGASA